MPTVFTTSTARRENSPPMSARHSDVKAFDEGTFWCAPKQALRRTTCDRSPTATNASTWPVKHWPAPTPAFNPVHSRSTIDGPRCGSQSTPDLIDDHQPATLRRLRHCGPEGRTLTCQGCRCLRLPRISQTQNRGGD